MNRYRIASALLTISLSAACSSADSEVRGPAEPTAEQVDALRTSLTTWDAGAVADLDPTGVTELITPRDALAVGTNASNLGVFSRKDINNGCRLLVIDADLRSELPGLSPEAALFDQCHGHSYRLDGTHTDPACERTLREYAVDVVDGRIIVTIADDDPNRGVAICSPVAGGH